MQGGASEESSRRNARGPRGSAAFLHCSQGVVHDLLRSGRNELPRDDADASAGQVRVFGLEHDGLVHKQPETVDQAEQRKVA